MTAEEFDLIRAAYKSAYPTFNVMPDKYSIKLWYRLLGDLDYKMCETALLELLATHTYPPSISEIRAKCTEYTMPHLKDEGEAWGEVQQAIAQYGYYREGEALACMAPTTREAVKRLGFREICLDENQDAVRAHFFRVYRAIADRKATEMQLPGALLEMKNRYISQLETETPKEVEEKAEAPEMQRASPEYIDSLLREHGFRRRG